MTSGLLTDASLVIAESSEARSRRRMHRALRVTAISLAVVGIFAAVMRTAVVAMTLATPADRRPELSAYDATALSALMWVSRLTAGSPEHTRTRAEVVRMSGKYAAHSRFTYVHMITGILIFLLAPLQFNRELRNRHRRLHRWTGRLVLALVVLSAASAIFFGVLDPKAPALERPTIAIFSALFLIAAARAFIAIRARDIVRHREWMIRMIAMAIGIGAVRVVSVPVAFFVRESWSAAFLTSMWVGWLLSIAVAEAWIRYTRPVRAVVPAGTAIA